MKKLFIITGANGHLGGTIVRMLNGRPVQVRGLVFGDKKKQDTGSIHYYSGDVREPETLRPLFEGCEDMETIVIHTAGIIDISNHVSPELYDVNVNGTKNILALCREYPVKRLVYVSSVHAIPEQKRGNVTGEIRDFSSDAVVGGYAKTKAEATREVLRAAQEGLDAVVVHPSGILGPYDRSGNHLVQMVAEYLHGTLPACVKGGYDFVDVRDVAEGCLLAAEKDGKVNAIFCPTGIAKSGRCWRSQGMFPERRSCRYCRCGWQKWRPRLYSFMPEERNGVRCTPPILCMCLEPGRDSRIKKLRRSWDIIREI